jgi:hypothetical protein
MARRVAGNVFVPCYLDETNCPTGATFLYSEGSSLPTQMPGNERAANFICNIPRSAVSGEQIRKVHPSLYGHGLLGSASEVDSGKLFTIGDDHGIMFCATDWIGLARDDRPTAADAYRDISGFPTAADRGQQGMLDFLYLGRAMAPSSCSPAGTRPRSRTWTRRTASRSPTPCGSASLPGPPRPPRPSLPPPRPLPGCDPDTRQRGNELILKP